MKVTDFLRTLEKACTELVTQTGQPRSQFTGTSKLTQNPLVVNLPLASSRQSRARQTYYYAGHPRQPMATARAVAYALMRMAAHYVEDGTPEKHPTHLTEIRIGNAKRPTRIVYALTYPTGEVLLWSFGLQSKGYLHIRTQHDALLELLKKHTGICIQKPVCIPKALWDQAQAKLGEEIRANSKNLETPLPSVSFLWVNIPGKHLKLLACTLYR